MGASFPYLTDVLFLETIAAAICIVQGATDSLRYIAIFEEKEKKKKTCTVFL